MLPPPPRSTLFPYTTLFRSQRGQQRGVEPLVDHAEEAEARAGNATLDLLGLQHEVDLRGGGLRRVVLRVEDRKSTRLNSSHTVISYAVFCLKKKTKKIHVRT